MSRFNIFGRYSRHLAKMKYRIFIILISILLFACSDNYDQNYDNFSDFNTATLRSKTWFPAIISSDAYNIQNTSSTNPVCAFGTFSYLNSNFYDSIFRNPQTMQIDFLMFSQKIKQHFERKPDWFLNVDNVSKNEIEIIKAEEFFIARQKSEKKVYFILCD